MNKLLAALCALFFSLSAWAVVNVNTATAQQLEAVKGLGPVKAKAIVDYRSKNGPFKVYADLEKVPGIGPKMLEKLKPELAVSGGAAAPAAATKPAAPAKKP